MDCCLAFRRVQHCSIRQEHKVDDFYLVEAKLIHDHYCVQYLSEFRVICLSYRFAASLFLKCRSFHFIPSLTPSCLPTGGTVTFPPYSHFRNSSFAPSFLPFCLTVSRLPFMGHWRFTTASHTKYHSTCQIAWFGCFNTRHSMIMMIQQEAEGTTTMTMTGILRYTNFSKYHYITFAINHSCSTREDTRRRRRISG